MREPACVGALIRGDQHRVHARRRAPDRPLLPGIWDIVGGHLDAVLADWEVEGRDGIRDGAPFALYAVAREGG